MIKVGITGHRNLDTKYIEQYKQKIYNKLLQLKQQYSNIILYSALADGADRLVVYEAIRLNIDFIAVLPMQIQDYKKDFDTVSQKDFDNLLKLSKQIIIIQSNKSDTRDNLYKKAGYFISDNSDILVALWDGKYNNLQGGTSEIVKYHIKNDKELYHIKIDRFN